MERREIRERVSSALKELSTYCRSSDTPTSWPSGEFLRDIQNDVMFLVKEERKKEPYPRWKAFRLLDKRVPSLQLVRRIDGLATRARERLAEVGKSPLDQLAQVPNESNRKLLRDLERVEADLGNAKCIEWREHEKALAQFCRTRTVELASKHTGPIQLQCYAKSLELLVVDQFRHKPLQIRAAPLIHWLADIKHPEGKSLLAFHHGLAQIVDRRQRAVADEAIRRQREQGSDRTRRHRKWVKGKFVYPGDWLRFEDGADFKNFYGKKLPLPQVCAGLNDSPLRAGLEAVLDDLSCGRALMDEPYWYYHRTLNIARCYDCQNAEWMEDGYQIEYGYPTTWCGSDQTREERRAELKRHALEEREKDERWLLTPKGQQWLRGSNLRLQKPMSQRKRK